MIHPSAVVDPKARIAADAEIGPFCVVGPGVEIGPGCRLIHSVSISGRTRIGARNVFHPFGTVGGDPQDFKFRGEDSETRIGDDNVFRESVTVNKGTAVGGNRTVVGNRNYFMACAHVAHDTIIEDHCILANACTLAGHIKVESWAILSGLVVVTHFVTIGQHAFVSGRSGLNQDAPPYMITQGIPGEVVGVNVVGLRRRGFPPATIDALREACRILWRKGLPRPEALSLVEKELGSLPEIGTLLSFLRATDRGRLGRARESERSASAVPEPQAELPR